MSKNTESTWARKLENAYLIEELMLQGHTTPAALARHPKLFGLRLSRPEIQRYIDAIQERWVSGLDRQTIDIRRAQVVNMYMNILQESYTILTELTDADNPNNVADRSRAVTNITRIIGQIAAVQGLNERTVRIGGDREGVPVRISQNSSSMVLTAMAQNGYLSEEDAQRLDHAIIAASTGQGQGESRGLWIADTATSTSGSSQGDYQSSPAADME